jgi:hypothetical protein
MTEREIIEALIVALDPIERAVEAVEAVDPLCPDRCAALRASFDYFTRHLGKDNEEIVERESVSFGDLKSIRDLRAQLLAALRAAEPAPGHTDLMISPEAIDEVLSSEPGAEAREVAERVREWRIYSGDFKLSDAEAAALVQDYVEKEAMRRAEIMNGELQARAEAAEAKLKEALSVIEERNGQLDKADTAPEAAETKLAKAREALKPFKEWRDHIEATSSRRLADNEFAEVSGMPRMGDLRRARAALKEIGEG